jgi:putative lipase involved disintegration of autophagic bodies
MFIWWHRMNINERVTSTGSQGGQVEQSTYDSPVTISKDAAFHLLQNSRRRAVLRYLIERDDEVYSMREVTEQVAAWENDTTISALTSNERQRVYIALYQSHLPKLDETDVIEYDRDRGTLSPTSLLSVFEPYLDEEHRAESVLTTISE